MHAGIMNIRGILLVDRDCWPPKISLFITSEKPRMALSGVRNSWLICAKS